MPFERSTLAEVRARAVSDVAANLGVPVLPRSVERALAEALSGAVHHLYGYLDWASRQLLPDTAEVEFLDRWAAILRLPRKAATFAVGDVDFAGTDGTEIPIGTRLRRSDDVLFETTGAAEIDAGAATASVAAVEAGAAGNTAAGTPLSLFSPVAGVQSGAVAQEISGGADREADEELRSRVLSRLGNPPRGGAPHDYGAWALEVAGVTRAWAFREWDGIGTVGVAFVRDDEDPIFPDQTERGAVAAYIDERRPVAARVVVFSPTAEVVDFTLSVTPSTAEIQAAVAAALEDLLTRRSEPGGTILLSEIRTAIGTVPGVADYIVTAPAADVQAPDDALPVMGVITWS
ncbi:MAG: baseplate J/gp47 family protein [bacterium]|nr:baseplate J/gp47 family protein [bacterium]